MLQKRFFVSWILALVLWFAGAYLINGQLIDYSPVYQLFRPWEEELSLFPVLVVADLMLTGAVVWFYVRGRNSQHWLGQGLRYGLSLFPLTIIPMYLRAWVAIPIPTKMLITQLVGFGVLLMIVGVVIAWVYRDSHAAA